MRQAMLNLKFYVMIIGKYIITRSSELRNALINAARVKHCPDLWMRTLQVYQICFYRSESDYLIMRDKILSEAERN